VVSLGIESKNTRPARLAVRARRAHGKDRHVSLTLDVIAPIVAERHRGLVRGPIAQIKADARTRIARHIARELPDSKDTAHRVERDLERPVAERRRGGRIWTQIDQLV